jgi:hypothetical protein
MYDLRNSFQRKRAGYHKGFSLAFYSGLRAWYIYLLEVGG